MNLLLDITLQGIVFDNIKLATYTSNNDNSNNNIDACFNPMTTVNINFEYKR